MWWHTPVRIYRQSLVDGWWWPMGKSWHITQPYYVYNRRVKLLYKKLFWVKMTIWDWLETFSLFTFGSYVTFKRYAELSFSWNPRVKLARAKFSPTVSESRGCGQRSLMLSQRILLVTKEENVSKKESKRLRNFSNHFCNIIHFSACHLWLSMFQTLILLPEYDFIHCFCLNPDAQPRWARSSSVSCSVWSYSLASLRQHGL